MPRSLLRRHHIQRCDPGGIMYIPIRAGGQENVVHSVQLERKIGESGGELVRIHAGQQQRLARMHPIEIHNADHQIASSPAARIMPASDVPCRGQRDNEIESANYDRGHAPA